MSIHLIDYEPLAWEPQPLAYARQGLCAQCIAQIVHDASECSDLYSATPNFVNTGIDCIKILSSKIAPDKVFGQGSKVLLVPIGYGTNQFVAQAYNGQNLFDFYNKELPRFRMAMYAIPLVKGNCVGVCTNDGLWEFQTDGVQPEVSYVPRSFGDYRSIFDQSPLMTR
ncbi:MAG: hypothetical protein NUV52_03610 [Candidatus Roizmanbacteria bacterium]|nr:hypothetical protein [Candidatus Roizmanbacteria bacterium]